MFTNPSQYALLLSSWEVLMKILTSGATVKKHEDKVNQGNKSVMKTSYTKANTVSEWAKFVSRMILQICTSAA